MVRTNVIIPMSQFVPHTLPQTTNARLDVELLYRNHVEAIARKYLNPYPSKMDKRAVITSYRNGLVLAFAWRENSFMCNAFTSRSYEFKFRTIASNPFRIILWNSSLEDLEKVLEQLGVKYYKEL